MRVSGVTNSGMLASDGARPAPDARPRWSGRGTGRDDGRHHRRRRARRLGSGLLGNRSARGRGRRNPGRDLRGLPAVSRSLLVRDVWATPRPIPTSHVPKLAGGAVIALALPVFLAAGLPVRAWLLAAVLWVAAEAVGLLLSRLSLDADNLAAAGVRGVGMMFRTVA